MSNYGMEYRNYYEGLKNKSNIKGKTTYTTFEQYIPNSLSKTGKKGKNKFLNNIINSIVNTFVLQMVGVVIMFLFVFAAKYSSDTKFDKYYDYLKNEINKETSFTEIKSEVEAFNITEFIVEVKDSIKWVKDRMEENPLNY